MEEIIRFEIKVRKINEKRDFNKLRGKGNPKHSDKESINMHEN